MKLVRYDAGHGPRLGVLEADGVHDVGPGDMRALLLDPPGRRGPRVQGARLLCPLPRPGKILVAAHNHGAAPAAATPWLITKLTDSVAGPGAPIVLWRFAAAVAEEVHLAAVLGEAGRVAGYTILNDVSALGFDQPAVRRSAEIDAQYDWLNGKWMDGYAVLGPCIAPPDEVALPAAIRSQVNGSVRQETSTAELLHGVDQVIAFAARLCRLRPGDVVALGSPRPPREGLRPGDVVQAEVAGIGILSNPVISEVAFT